MKPRHACALITLACLSAITATAATPDDAQAVIVVLRADTPFNQFAAQADERAAAEPAAWNYLDRGVVGAVQRLEGLHQFKAKHVYSHAVKGFAGKLTQAQIAALRASPWVKYIEADGPMQGDAQSIPWGIDRIEADLSSTVAGNGSGSIDNVHVYVIDSGIGKHKDLNLVDHVNFAGGKNTDCEGHGTHVAGTIAARDDTKSVVGVAPGAPLVGVKVLNCNNSGERANVIKGVDWVTANAILPAVANMSLGGDPGVTLDDAVLASAASGVFYGISAGNDSRSACRQSPARAGQNIDDVPNGVVTTAATDINDKEASFSNYGPCVDIWAPGVNVVSDKLGGGTTSKSGTSMATPHVTGAGALYLSTHPTATAAQVEAALLDAVIQPGKKSQDGRLIDLLQVNQF